MIAKREINRFLQQALKKLGIRIEIRNRNREIFLWKSTSSTAWPFQSWENLKPFIQATVQIICFKAGVMHGVSITSVGALLLNLLWNSLSCSHPSCHWIPGSSVLPLHIPSSGSCREPRVHPSKQDKPKFLSCSSWNTELWMLSSTLICCLNCAQHYTQKTPQCSFGLLGVFKSCQFYVGKFKPPSSEQELITMLNHLCEIAWFE